MNFRRLIAPVMALSVAGCALALPATSHASYLLDRQATKVSIQADRKGNALVTYKLKGKTKRVLLWGGVNSTLKFKVDRSAGWKSKRINHKKKFPNACRKVSAATVQAQTPAQTVPGQQVQVWNVVAACKARDGSFWVAQSWPRVQQNFGGLERGTYKELRISHFKGQTANMWIKPGWSWSGQWMHIYGQLTYQGRGWWGAGNEFGASIDGKARNVAFDAFDSDYPGTAGQWARVNAILTNNPNGQFCFGFAPKLPSEADASAAFRRLFPLWRNTLTYWGVSSTNQYRAIVPGPGVSPDIKIDFAMHDPATYWVPDPSSQSGRRYTEAGWQLDQIANQEQWALTSGVAGGSCYKVN